MRVVLVFAALASLVASEVEAAPGAELAGAWKQQSDAQELTLVPKLKISPSISATGMVIGTMGYGGSSTTTTLQNEFAPIRTQRAMSLVVRPDGGFTWIIDKSRAASAQKPDCQVVVREEKTGQVRISGGQAVFEITGGTQSSRDTCDASKSSRSAKTASQETYSYAVTGGTLKLSGPGGTNWTFSRG